MMTYNPLYGNYRTRTLSDIFGDVSTFAAARATFEKVCPRDLVSDDDLELIYLLLMGRYGDSHIAASNENRFVLSFITRIGACAPAFLKNLEIQKAIKGMNLQEACEGGISIANHAANPNTSPSTATLEEVTYIDSQTTQKVKRSKLDGYANLVVLLDTDLYENFTRQFANFFVRIAAPRSPLYYENEIEEDTTDD